MNTFIALKKVLLHFLLLIFCLVAPVEAQKVIRIGFAENYPPFYFLNSENRYEGVSFEVVSSVLTDLGYTIRVSQHENMSALIAEVKKGNVDLNVNLSATEERKQYFLFTAIPHVYESQDLISLKNTPFNYTGSLLSLSRYRVGVIYGWTHGAEFDNADFIRKVYVLDSQTQLQGLISGRFDMVVNNRFFFSEMGKKLGIASVFKSFEPSLGHLPVTVGVSRQYPDAPKLVEQLNLEISKFIKTREYLAILHASGLGK